MDNKRVFAQMIKETNLVALASAADGAPSVRLVSVCFDEEQPGVLYFSTDPRSRKVMETTQDPRVALASVPADPTSTPHATASDATMQKSARDQRELKPLFLQIPGYAQTLEALGDEEMNVYEIHLRSARIVLDYDRVETVTF